MLIRELLAYRSSRCKVKVIWALWFLLVLFIISSIIYHCNSVDYVNDVVVAYFTYHVEYSFFVFREFWSYRSLLHYLL